MGFKYVFIIFIILNFFLHRTARRHFYSSRILFIVFLPFKNIRKPKTNEAFFFKTFFFFTIFFPPANISHCLHRFLYSLSRIVVDFEYVHNAYAFIWILFLRCHGPRTWIIFFFFTDDRFFFHTSVGVPIVWFTKFLP